MGVAAASAHLACGLFVTVARFPLVGYSENGASRTSGPNPAYRRHHWIRPAGTAAASTSNAARRLAMKSHCIGSSVLGR